MDRDSVFQIVRKHWTKAPVDVQAIIRESGIEYAEEKLPPDVSGMIEAEGATYRIVVNRSDYPPRRRFTAAHELGHYIYHRKLIGEGITDNRLYRSAGNSRSAFGNPRITSAHETEANRFAANLLMPPHLVNEMKSRGRTIPEMARALGVSVPAMRVRMGLPPTSDYSEYFEPNEESAAEPALF